MSLPSHLIGHSVAQHDIPFYLSVGKGRLKNIFLILVDISAKWIEGSNRKEGERNPSAKYNPEFLFPK